MKKFLYITILLGSASLFACQGNETGGQVEEQQDTEQHDSFKNSILDEADRALSTGDTTFMPADSAGTMKK